MRVPVALGALLFLCAASPRFERFTSQTSGFIIELPAEWPRRENAEGGKLILSADPGGSGYFGVAYMPGKKDAEAMIKERTQTGGATRARLIGGIRPGKLDGEPAWEYDTEYLLPLLGRRNPDGSVPQARVREFDLVVQRPGGVLLLSYSDSPTAFDRNLPVLKHILETMKLSAEPRRLPGSRYLVYLLAILALAVAATVAWLKRKQAD